MNLLQLQNGTKQIGSKLLFNNASFAVNEGEHVGVIGPNGAGKTTLFKILVAQLELDSGLLVKSQQLRIGYLEQESEWSLDQTSEEYLASHCIKPIWELKQLGLELGLSESHFKSALHSLSGGYRMRMKLLYLIGQEPNLMLLDEPTNFLDLESILALERFLQDYKGAFLLISHDREFLRRTTDSTLEVEAGDLTKFPGNIDDYFEQKAQLREILEAQAANQDAKRKKIQDFIDRFGAKATKARQAQSRMKQLEKMEVIEIKEDGQRAKIKIPPPTHTGKESIALTQANLGYPQNVILKNVNLRIERGNHIGVVGFNGAGKSTLLKSLAGLIPLLSGTRTIGYQVSLSHFSQHSADQLDLNDSVLDALQKAAHPEITQQNILNIAGSLLFSGDDVHKKVKVLSGGEKSRVALGQLLLKKSPLLLLDEPTNHLDFDTVETLTSSLKDYEGTIVVVSHDRAFISRISTKILEIRDGTVEVYHGTYDDYVWSLQKGALNTRLNANNQAVKSNSQSDKLSVVQTVSENQKFNYREETKKLNTKIRELQNQIVKDENLLNKLMQKQGLLNSDLMNSQGPQVHQISNELSVCSQEIILVEEKLMQNMEELESCQNKLNQIKNPV